MQEADTVEAADVVADVPQDIDYDAVYRVKLQRVSLIEFAQNQGGVLNNNPTVIGVIDKLHMASSFNLSF